MLSRVDRALVRVEAKTKPLLRGVSHQVGFFVALLAGTLLVHVARGTLASASAAVYATTLAALLGTSALYHRPTWGAQTRALLRRCDHAAIYLLIAGTFTPVMALALPGRATLPLALAWTGAAAGIAKNLAWPSAPKWLEAALCVALGWIAVPFLPALRQLLSTADISLLVIGGLAYSVGALVYALKVPDPVPQVFGYHEVFHALVLVAAGCHFAVVWTLVTR